MTSDGLGEMFAADSADTCAGKFPLMLMGGQAEGLACIDQGARNPIGLSGNLNTLIFQLRIIFFKGTCCFIRQPTGILLPEICESFWSNEGWVIGRILTIFITTTGCDAICKYLGYR